MPDNSDDYVDLMELYTSEADIEEALRQKEEGEAVFEDVGATVKDFPNAQRELDLHGHNGMEAMLELVGFIGRSIDQKVRTVRVITGKGIHSENMHSVLPELTEKKLGELRRAGKVLAFKREKTGGAFTVYLVS
jgi:DNA-nicking Smr family endonuclease